MTIRWLFFILICCSLPAHGVTFTNSDGSNLSAVCIAAAKSDDALREALKQFGFNQRDLDVFTCNGLPIDEFAKRYNDTEGNDIVRVYAFEAREDNRETQLCVAAATSNQTFIDVKNRLFGQKRVSDIYCNGIPIEKFARRYGNKQFSLH
ncbi:hypothetical protein OE749_07890 [Aestuariibacter sp. AA17]|uniref:DUF3718 domain-containing protein n=1 Tax=Fluctibacter corallii TaxID=2984329 RepID=A0ABT3A7E2_9ALTE|nr:hypothetical protein [Aestuariibacter sp. AA17]MCV2884613.1 hypothetical protein [Aestuariibacter sp. AA17]